MSQSFIDSTSSIVIAVSVLIGIVFAFLKMRKTLSETDPGKKVRTSEKHRLEALNFFTANCSDQQSFVIDESDSQTTAAHKNHLWKAYDVKYSTVNKFDKEEIDSLSKPLETLLEYQSAAGDVKRVKANSGSDDKEWAISTGSKYGKWSFRIYAIGALLSTIVCLQLALQVGLHKLGISDIKYDLMPYLLISSASLLAFGMTTFATYDAYKTN